jgi:hypothetical protein
MIRTAKNGEIKNRILLLFSEEECTESYYRKKDVDYIYAEDIIYITKYQFMETSVKLVFMPKVVKIGDSGFRLSQLSEIFFPALDSAENFVFSECNLK